MTGKLLLYIVPGTANSVQAEKNLRAVMHELDDGDAGLDLEIVSVLTSPERAAADRVIVTPTLIGLKHNGPLVIMGNLTDTIKLRLTLQSLRDAEKIEKMGALVAEKDRLLVNFATMAEELNHRVRNNFHLIQAMLNNHRKIASSAADKASVDAIVRRVATIAAIYDHLLVAGMGGTIDLGVYVTSLCQTFRSLQATSDNEVKLICATESLFVDLDSVTVIGLVIAESLSNSYKHAFQNGDGTINVSLRRSEQIVDQAVLIVRDNGPGFIERAGSKRHGIGLLRRLMHKVNGTAELRVDQGTIWTFHFAAAVRGS